MSEDNYISKPHKTSTVLWFWYIIIFKDMDNFECKAPMCVTNTPHRFHSKPKRSKLNLRLQHRKGRQDEEMEILAVKNLWPASAPKTTRARSGNGAIPKRKVTIWKGKGHQCGELYKNDKQLLTQELASLVHSRYVASEQTAKKTLLPTIRLLLSAHLLPGNAFTEPLLSNLEATTPASESTSHFLNVLQHEIQLT
jgi:hypothetical protein